MDQRYDYYILESHHLDRNDMVEKPRISEEVEALWCFI